MKSQLESLRAKQGNTSQQQRHLVWQRHTWEIRAHCLPARIPLRLSLLSFQCLVFSGSCGIRDIWGEKGALQTWGWSGRGSVCVGFRTWMRFLTAMLPGMQQDKACFELQATRIAWIQEDEEGMSESRLPAWSLMCCDIEAGSQPLFHLVKHDLWQRFPPRLQPYTLQQTSWSTLPSPYIACPKVLLLG